MLAGRTRRRVPSSERDAAAVVVTPARTSRTARLTTVVFYCVFQLAVLGTVASKIDGGWDTEPNTQYHIQTDEGPERYFKYQTISGQYRKERRLQDGSVVGTYGWVDADGYLRLNDYVADSKGYRIVKNKKLFVGAQAPVGQAVSAAKYAPAAAGTAVSVSPYRSASTAIQATQTAFQATQAVQAAQTTQTPQPQRQSSWRGSPFVYPSDSDSSPLRFPAAAGISSTRSPPPHHRSAAAAAHYRRPPSGYGPVRPVDVNSIADDEDDGRAPYRRRSSATSPQPPVVAVTPPSAAAQSAVRPHTFRPAYRKVVQVQRDDGHDEDDDATAQGSDPSAARGAPPGYDGVSFVRNGFRYYLPRHYHEERTDDAAGDTRTGSFGYVDPFGIRRVVYYNTAPGTGFVHRKNNRYVGLDAEPYDPRPLPQ